MSTTTDRGVGAPCWVSLTSRDPEAAERFYGRVMGWGFQDAGDTPGLRIALTGGVPVAGIAGLGEGSSGRAAWTPYFSVDSVTGTAARITERGGTLAVGPLSFGGGRVAWVADRDGALFGIREGLPLGSWRPGPGPAPAWPELRTRDAFAAALFYGEVLAWAEPGPGCCAVSYENERVVLRDEGRAVARLRGGALEEAPDPAVRPRWHVNLRVPDPGAAAERARVAGASVLPGPGGARATSNVLVRDPEGALFTLTDEPAGPSEPDDSPGLSE
ncbi:VOC family protein [Streptomyces sp. BI20]|uniref:VOC family protein n=1 Tax=Streptomyces sp. BI20 TaxID=3403460 RepID=UPI003C78B5B9